ncbi:MAG: DedA family protein [Erysipelotrichaceae bacterium]|nr:DedA family protein [Erysipelotrichaceae bacterium]MBR3693552.1 VTT domain-containing protein [Erysipelotrichales bacterium]
MKTIFLLLYSTFKAFLPLPSLEVILIPLIIETPSFALFYSLIGGIGTFVGGSIGYAIAYYLGSKWMDHLSSQDTIRKGMELVSKHGVIAVFIGGITPIPDFLLAYLAGLTRMNYWPFAITDALARFLRSILVSYVVILFGYVIDMDKWGSIISLVIIVYFVLKWGFTKEE